MRRVWLDHERADLAQVALARRAEEPAEGGHVCAERVVLRLKEVARVQTNVRTDVHKDVVAVGCHRCAIWPVATGRSGQCGGGRRHRQIALPTHPHGPVASQSCGGCRTASEVGAVSRCPTHIVAALAIVAHPHTLS